MPPKFKIPATAYKQQDAQEIFYTDPDIIETMNDEVPISFENYESITKRTAFRYPFVEKKIVELICLTCIQSLREIIIGGAIINFDTLFEKFKFLPRKTKSPWFPAGIMLQTRIYTPPSLRDYKEETNE